MKTILTKDCFKGKNIYWRDSGLDSWLPEKQKIEKIGKVQYHSWETPITFIKMVQKFFGTTDTEKLKKYCFTLPHIEEMIEKPEEYGLKTDGWLNFFLVDSNDDISVVWAVYVYWCFDGWRVSAPSLGCPDEWPAGHRVFSRNLDTLPLDSSDTSLEKAIEVVKKAGYQISKII